MADWVAGRSGGYRNGDYLDNARIVGGQRTGAERPVAGSGAYAAAAVRQRPGQSHTALDLLILGIIALSAALAIAALAGAF